MELLGNPVYITYKNWKGVIGHRRVHPIKIWYGGTEFHQELQWFLHAIDIEKGEERNFAMKDVMMWNNDAELSPII